MAAPSPPSDLALDIGFLSTTAQEAGSKSPKTNPSASALDPLGPTGGAASSLYGAAFLAATAEEAAAAEAAAAAQEERGLDLMAEQLTWHANETRARALRRVSTAAVFGNGGGSGFGGASGPNTPSAERARASAGFKGNGSSRGGRRGGWAWLFGGRGKGGGEEGGEDARSHAGERPSPMPSQKGGFVEASLHGTVRGSLGGWLQQQQQQQQQGMQGQVQQYNQIRTLTFWRDGRREEARLSVKELLRYIQTAVRTVHQREQQALAAAGLPPILPMGTSGGLRRGGSIGSAAGLTRRPSQSSAAFVFPVTREKSQGGTSRYRAVEDPNLPPPSSHHYHLHHHALSPPRSLMGSLASTLGLGGSNSKRDSKPPPPPPNVQAAAAALAGMAAGKKEVGVLNARDVRRLITGLDSESARSKEMSVAVRRHTIVLNLDELRCLLLYDRLIVIVPEGADPDCHGRLDANLNWLRVQRRAFSLAQRLAPPLRPEGVEGGVEEDDDDDGGDEPFELLALEAALMTMAEFLQSKIDVLQPRIAKTNRALLGRATLATKHHDMLRQLKNKVTLYQNKARSLHKTILHLLEDEDDLTSLHLTRTMMRLMEATTQSPGSPLGPTSIGSNPPPPPPSNTHAATSNSSHHEPAGLFNYPPLTPERPTSAPAAVGGGFVNGVVDVGQTYEQEQAAMQAAGAVAAAHTEAEELLESYLADLYEIIMKWELIRDDMQTTEEYVLMKLDMARNRLLTYGTIFTLINMLFAFAAVVTGVFGMNLANGINEHSGSPESHLHFLLVTGILAGVMLLVGGFFVWYMQRRGMFVR